MLTGLLGFHDDYGLPDSLPCLFNEDNIDTCLTATSFDQSPWHFKMRISLLLPKNVTEHSITIKGTNLMCAGEETVIYVPTVSNEGFKGDFKKCVLDSGSTEESCRFRCQCDLLLCSHIFLWRRQNFLGLDPNWQLHEIIPPGIRAYLGGFKCLKKSSELWAII